MAKRSCQGITEVLHDSEGPANVTLCNTPGCFRHNVTYAASPEQIGNLIDISASCEQSVTVSVTVYRNFSFATIASIETTVTKPDSSNF